jgi:proline iminopeptidase
MDHHSVKAYDLKKWRVIQFDQRGCGHSTPFGTIDHNTTWDLVADMEKLREHLHIDKWFISGGSWGTTLALAYAETHPERVTGLLLRGTCFCDEESMKWLYEEGGASEVFPDSWERRFLSVLPPRLHHKGWKEICAYYHKMLNGPSPQRYANAWWGWEGDISQLIPVPDDTTPKDAVALARLENHYFVNGCWLKEGQLLKNAHKLRSIPITMVHGRYDMVCPITAAYALKDALPHSRLVVVPNAGHSSYEPGIRRELRRATEKMFTNRRSTRKQRHKEE